MASFKIRKPSKKIAVSVFLAYCCLFCCAQQRTIPELIKLITNHQFPVNPLVEGDYAKGSWEKVTNAKMPKTMYWSYPVGVLLLGMQRGYEVTRDKNVLKYINENNRIS